MIASYEFEIVADVAICIGRFIREWMQTPFQWIIWMQ